jgi:hypothetical protein
VRSQYTFVPLCSQNVRLFDHVCIGRHNRHLVWLWKVNHNTLAGDAAVTIFVQTIITWLLDSAMVCNDVRTRAYGVRPISMSPKALNNKFLNWYISAEGMELLEPHITLKARLKCFVIGIIKAFLLCILVFFIWWPITVAILVGVGHSIGAGQYQYNHWPVCVSLVVPCTKHNTPGCLQQLLL